MSKFKKRLIALLLVQMVLALVHVAFREPQEVNEGIFSSPWHFWLGLWFGVFVVLYALSLRCPNTGCRKMQVFRGYSVFDLRWPEEKCYSCGAPLSSVYKNGRPVEH